MTEIDDRREAFFQAHATADHMAPLLADCIRHCMRAMAADDPRPARDEALRKFDQLMALMAKSKGIKLRELLSAAIDSLRPQPSWLLQEWSYEYYYESKVRSAAARGFMLFVETSSVDQLAQARISKRELDFLRSIEVVVDAPNAIERDRQLRPEDRF